MVVGIFSTAMTTKQTSKLEVLIESTASPRDGFEPVERLQRSLDKQGHTIVDRKREETDKGTRITLHVDEGDKVGQAQGFLHDRVEESDHIIFADYQEPGEPQSTDEVTTRGDPSRDDIVPQHEYDTLLQSYKTIREQKENLRGQLEALTDDYVEDVKALEAQRDERQEHLDRIATVVGHHPTEDGFYNTLEDRLQAEPTVDEQATHAKNSETNTNLAVAAQQLNAGTQELIAYTDGRDAFRTHHLAEIDDVNTWEEAQALGRAYLAQIVRDGYQERLDEHDVSPNSLDGKQQTAQGLRDALQGAPGEPDQIKDSLEATEREIRMIKAYQNGRDTYNAVSPGRDELETVRNLVEDIEQRRHHFDALFQDLGSLEAHYQVRVGDNPTAELYVPGDNVDELQRATWGVLIDEIPGDAAQLPANTEFTGQPVSLQNANYEQHEHVITNVKDRLSAIGIDATITYDYGRQTTI
jgi:hypothetical protein